MKSIRKTGITIITYIVEHGKESVRKLAQNLALKKSSVHRHIKAIERRNKYPESALWETESGAKWLFILVLAAMYVFGLKSNVGADRLSEFFKLIRIHHHVGVSCSSIRKKLSEMEAKIQEYEQIHRSKKIVEGTKAVLSADEVFFGGIPHLVLMDLVSGFIIVEESAPDRAYETWMERVEAPVKALGIEVLHAVSDRAPALIKMAVNGFGCKSGADIFHPMRDISRWLGTKLGQQKKKVEKKLISIQKKLNKLSEKQGNEQAISDEKIRFEEIRKQHVSAENEQEKYRTQLRGISEIIHPFHLNDSSVKTSKRAEEQLEDCAKSFAEIAADNSIVDTKGKLASFRNHFKDMCSIVDVWWIWVCGSVKLLNLSSDEQIWLTEVLLPVVYWHKQMEKTDNPTFKVTYRNAWQKAHSALDNSLVELPMSAEKLEEQVFWADWMCNHFHRSSSAVEGRNGYLAQMYHNGRGLRRTRLRTSTVLHNYDTRRKDGTTPAERLFKCDFPGLFNWLIENMSELPLARRGKKRAVSNPLNLQTVPL